MKHAFGSRGARQALGLALLMTLGCVGVEAQVVRGPSMGGIRAGAGDRGPSASVPLPFAPERSGLPIPVQVQFVGGGRVHNAGLGWHMPLSFLQVRDDDIGQLPRADGQRAKRVMLSIGGMTVDLVAVSSDATRWTPRDLSQSGELVRESATRWIYKSGPVRYIFETIQSTDANRFWLKEIRGEGPNSLIRLNYTQTSVASLKGVTDQLGEEFANNPGHETLLTSLEYNFFPGYESSICAKHRVSFEYESPLSEGDVLDVSIASPTAASASITTKVLSSVTFRTSDSEGACTGVMTRTQRVELNYEDDPDTGMPRLLEVKARGREGAGETPLPIAKYRYGAGGGDLQFEPAESRTLTSGTLPTGLAESFSRSEFVSLIAGGTAPTPVTHMCETPGSELFAQEQAAPGTDDLTLQRLSARVPVASRGYVGSAGTCDDYPQMTLSKTWSTFTDFTGDGRPDWVYRENDAGALKIAVNRSSASAVLFENPVNLFTAANFDVASVNDGSLPLNLTATSKLPQGGGHATLSTTWVTMIDMNGDGRLDILDARHPGKKWIVYINAPPHLPAHGHFGEHPSDYQPTTTAPIRWMRTEMDVTTAQETLAAAFGETSEEVDGMLQAANGWPGGASRLPLETVFSGPQLHEYQAYVFNPTWDVDCLVFPDDSDYPAPGAEVWQDQNCWQPITPAFKLGGNNALDLSVSRSITLHRLRDANADGYPDILFAGINGSVTVDRGIHEGDPGWSSYIPYPNVSAFHLEQAACLKFVRSYDDSNDQGDLFEMAPSTECPALNQQPWTLQRSAVPYYWETLNAAHPYVSPAVGEMWSVGSVRGLNHGAFGSGAFVLHNVAGAALGAHAAGDTFSDDVKTLWSGGCYGLEMWINNPVRAQEEGSMGVATRTAELLCAVRDVNGDGLLDLLGDSHYGFYGVPEAGRPARATARLGTGTGLSATRVDVPLTAGLYSYAQVPQCTGAGRLHPDYLGNVTSAPTPSEFYVTQAFQLSDLNGDGHIDSAGNTGRLGAGVADVDLLPAFQLDVDAFYGKPDEDDPCGVSADIDFQLLDFNGDGRLDKASLANGQLHVSQLRRSSGDPDVGLLTQHRLTEVTDGYGAGVKYTYANAKHDNTTRHEVPFAEIVVAKTEPVGEPTDDPDLPQQEPTYFAYGDIQMHYSELAGHFVPTGYAKQATLRGRTVGSKIRGVGTVSYARTLNSTYSSTFISEVQRDLLVGSKDKERTFEGEFDLADGTWDLLLQTADDEDPLRAETRHKYQVAIALHADDQSMEQPADRANRNRCRRTFWPYGGAQALVGSLTDPISGLPVDINGGTRECAGRLDSQLVELSSTSGLFKANGSADDRTVASKVTYEDFDVRGRALRTRDHRNVVDTTDDVCTVVSFAEPITGSDYATLIPGYDGTNEDERLLGRMNQLLDAVQSAEVTDCGTRVLSKVITEYDTVGATGYDRGWPLRTRTLFEKADGTFTNESEAIVSATTAFNDYGQPITTTTTTIEGLSELAGTPLSLTSTTSLSYDPFQLVVLDTETASSDDSTVLRTSRTVDPVSLQVATTTGQDGDVTRTYYDAYDRPSKVTVSHPGFNGGAEYIIGATEYSGDTATTHSGRKVRTKVFTAWTLASAYDPNATAPGVDERWSETYFDGLGQFKYTQYFLGTSAPYGGKKLRSGSIKYDSLGRMVFVGKKPYVATGYGPELAQFGTTFRYPDYSTEPVCHWDSTAYLPDPGQPYTWKLALEEPVSGVKGYQTPTIPHTSTGAFGSAMSPVECSLTSFEPNGVKSIQMHATGFDSNRTNDPLVATAEVYDGAGNLVERRTWDGTSQTAPAAQTRYEYDRFGRMESVTRYREPNAVPSAQPGGALTTSMAYDGLGRVASLEVPQASPVSFGYDLLGREIFTEQADDDGQLQRFGRRYDGFGRVAESGRLQNNLSGFDTSDSSHTQTSFHTDGEFGAGRPASIVRSGAPAEEIEFDLFGRTLRTTSVQGTRSVEQELEYDGLGRIARTIDRVDDNAQTNEYTRFQYDSAGRLRRIEHGLGPVYELVSDVIDIDVWGNPKSVTRGNGSSVAYSYGSSNSGRFPLPLSSVATDMAGVVGMRDQRSIGYNRDLWERPTSATTRFLDRDGTTTLSDVTHVVLSQYDGLGRLKNSKLRVDTSAGPGPLSMNESYRYDALGNRSHILNELNPAQSLALVPRADNLDWICRPTVGTFSASSPLPPPEATDCTVSYDARGRVTEYTQPFTGVEIDLEHTQAGEVAAVKQGVLRTEYAYGAGGGVASRGYVHPTLDSEYLVLGTTEERPNSSGGKLVERHLTGGVHLRGAPGTGSKLYDVAQLGAATSVMNQANAETSFRIYSPLGRRIGGSGTDNSSATGTLYQAPGEDVCGYHGTCSAELYRVRAGIYDPYLGRLMH